MSFLANTAKRSSPWFRIFSRCISSRCIFRNLGTKSSNHTHSSTKPMASNNKNKIDWSLKNQARLARDRLGAPLHTERLLPSQSDSRGLLRQQSLPGFTAGFGVRLEASPHGLPTIHVNMWYKYMPGLDIRQFWEGECIRYMLFRRCVRHCLQVIIHLYMDCSSLQVLASPRHCGTKSSTPTTSFRPCFADWSFLEGIQHECNSVPFGFIHIMNPMKYCWA